MHEHDHDCECGCHEKKSSTDAPYELSVHAHDLAVIASYKIRLNCSTDTLEEMIEDFMLKIGNDVKAAGGRIGHIKAFASFENTGIQFSLTLDIVNKVFVAAKSVFVEGVTIVFCIDTNRLDDILRESLDQLLQYIKK